MSQETLNTKSFVVMMVMMGGLFTAYMVGIYWVGSTDDERIQTQKEKFIEASEHVTCEQLRERMTHNSLFNDYNQRMWNYKQC